MAAAIKKLKIGNLRFDFHVDARHAGSFLRYFKSIKTMNSGNERLSCSVQVVGLLKGDKRGTDEEYTREVFKEYIMSAGLSNHNALRTIHFVKTYTILSRYEKFQDLLKRIKGSCRDDFLMMSVDPMGLLLVNIKKRMAVLATRRVNTGAANYFAYGFSIYSILNIFAPAADSFVLHSSAVSMNGKGYLFVGESGSGKTTIARLILRSLKNARMLADDFNLISYERGLFYAYRIPLDKTRGFKNRLIYRMPVNMVCLINQSKKAGLIKVAVKGAFSEILSKHLPNQYWFRNNAGDFPRLLLRFLRKHETVNLSFKPDVSFLEILKKH